MNFFTQFFQILTFSMLYSPKQHVLLKVLTLNKVPCFSRWALHAARNKQLEDAQPGKFSYVKVLLLGQELLYDCLRDQLKNIPNMFIPDVYQ